ncbi:MAG TPA: Clp protease N-terminal domain-containing protein [Pseudonocardiaceae bacterium]
MPKVNVYLPDELAEAVKEWGLPVSPICQQALESVVRRMQSIEANAKLDLAADDPTAKLESFTERARTAVKLAIQRAKDSGAPAVTTEHLLSGVLDTELNMALEVLRSLEIEPDDLRDDLDHLATRSSAQTEYQASRQLDPTTTEALKLALREAITLAHNYIGCEHLLLGLINEPNGGAGQILRARGAEPRSAHRVVSATLSGFIRGHRTAGEQAGPAALREVLAQIGARLDRLEERIGQP